MTEQQHFTALIRRVRERSGMTQREFARVLRIDQPKVSEWETGKHSQLFIEHARIMLALRDQFGVRLEDVIG